MARKGSIPSSWAKIEILLEAGEHHHANVIIRCHPEGKTEQVRGESAARPEPEEAL